MINKGIKNVKNMVLLSSSVMFINTSFFSLANDDRYAYELITQDEISRFNKVSELEKKYNHKLKNKWISNYVDINEKIPDARKIARDLLNNHYRGKVPDIKVPFDANQFYYVTFKGAASDRHSFTGWHHKKHDVVSAVKLTDAALANSFQNIERDSLSSYSGIYYSGYGEPDYGVNNEVKILSRNVSDFVWNADIQSMYTQQSKLFWKDNKHKYTQLYKDTFTLLGFQSFKENKISLDAMNIIEAMSRDDFSLSHHYYVDVYGYKSNSILWIESLDKSSALLYIPGAKQSFVEFKKTNTALVDMLRQYIKQHLSSPDQQTALAKHFSLYDRQQGTTYSGVDAVLKSIANGSWAPSYIMYDKTLISGNPFNAIADATRTRLESDSDVQIKSDSEISVDHALRTVSAIFNMIPVVDIVAPEIGVPLGIALNSTQLGLSIDIAASADTLRERRDGVYNVAFSSANLAASYIIPTLLQQSAKLSLLNPALSGEVETNFGPFSFNNSNDIPIEYEFLKITDKPLPIKHPITGEDIFITRLANEPDVVALAETNHINGRYSEVDFQTGELKPDHIHRGLYEGEPALYSSEPLICF